VFEFARNEIIRHRILANAAGVLWVQSQLFHRAVPCFSKPCWK